MAPFRRRHTAPCTCPISKKCYRAVVSYSSRSDLLWFMASLACLDEGLHVDCENPVARSVVCTGAGGVPPCDLRRLEVDAMPSATPELVPALLIRTSGQALPTMRHPR